MERLLWDRLSLEDGEIPFGRRREVVVTREDLQRAGRRRCASARSATRPGRERFRERLAGMVASRVLDRDSLAGQDEALSAVRKTKEYQQLVEQGVAAARRPRGWSRSCSRTERGWREAAGDLLSDEEIVAAAERPRRRSSAGT